METNSPHVPNGGGQIVYVRPIDIAELPDDVQTQVQGFAQLFSVHDAEGQQLALVADKTLAFELARQHDYAPVSVH